MLTKNLILNWTQRIKLPLKVRSTALQLSDKLNNYHIDFPNKYEKLCFLAKICIFLGCKFEDIHGHLNKIMENIELLSGYTHMSKIIEIEEKILEFLDFEFNFPNLYQSALAVHLLTVDETNYTWENTLDCLNKALLGSDLNSKHMELVLSSFPRDSYLNLDLKYNYDLVNTIKNNVSSIKYLSDKDIVTLCDGKE